jgi:hypothetical protein
MKTGLRGALLSLTCWGMSGQAATLELRRAGPSVVTAGTPVQVDQLLHSRAAYGAKDIEFAWLAGATGRYRHGVLGDALEAGRLMLRLRDGTELSFELPDARVFEDLEPRLADLDGDGRDEIIVVESDQLHGASLALFGERDGRVVRVGATPFLGQANRWLNPLGVGDFDGDGRADIALVAIPHIGGVLRLYRYAGAELVQFAQRTGVSTHRIGSTELGLGRVVPSRPRDRLLVPDQTHTTLMLLEWAADGWRVEAQVQLPRRLVSSLEPAGADAWRLRLEDDSVFEVVITH